MIRVRALALTMTVLLRSASVLALFAAALSASAQVTYTYSVPNVNYHAVVTFVLPLPPTSTTSYRAPFVTGNYSDYPLSYATIAFSADRRTFGVGIGNDTYGGLLPITTEFDASLLTSSGTRTVPVNGHTFTSVVNPTPEPATMAALGLGALAFVKRRKRA